MLSERFTQCFGSLRVVGLCPASPEFSETVHGHACHVACMCYSLENGT